MEYRRILGTDTWQWMRTCGGWPGHSYDSVRLRGKLRPPGKLCETCMAQEAKVQKNKKKAKRRKRDE